MAATTANRRVHLPLILKAEVNLLIQFSRNKKLVDYSNVAGDLARQLNDKRWSGY